jgi:hypothetical protein
VAVVILGVLAAAPSALAGSGVRLAPVSHLTHPFGNAVHSGRTFQMVGVRWKGTGTVRLQARSTSGTWTPWVALSQEAPVWTGPARRIRMRRSGDVRDLAVTFITSPRVTLPARGTVIPAAAGRPAIVTRAGWHADESIRRAQPSYAPALKMVFVHHTDTATSAPCSDSARIVRGIYAYHVRTNGWNDIGYNFLVDKCGTVFEGRYGGMTKPVIGAQTKGFNTGSAGIAIIGTYSSARPRPAAVAALERLIAWRLDVAHVDPESRVEMVSSGNPRYRAGRHVVMNAVSGHRDGYPTSCPGSALYALLPRIRAAALAIGLPKIWAPTHTPNLHRIAPDAAIPLEFRARFSKRLAFTLTIRGPGGAVVARRRHTNHHIRWTWPGQAGVLPGGVYSWSISAPGARAFEGTLGVLPLWGLRAPPDGFSVTQGTVTAGGLASLVHPEGSTLDLAPAGGDPRTELVTDFGLPATRAVTTAGILAGASVATTAGGPVDVALWDFGSSSWVDIGSCTAVPGRACKVQGSANGHTFASWDAPSSSARMRVRYTFPGAAAVDAAHALLNG